MDIRLEGGRLVLAGVVGVEDAEPLLAALRANPGAGVDLAGCEHLHAAALQVLIALRPPLVAAPADRWLAAALGRGLA